MVAALPLDDDEGVKFDFHPGAPIPESAQEVGMRDYDIAVMGVAPNVISKNLAGAAQWVTGGGSDSWAGRWRDFADERVQANVAEMSPAAQRAYSAEMLPSEGIDIWDENVQTGHALGLNLAANAPDLILSMFGGAAAARIATRLGAGALKAAGVATATATAPGVAQVGGDLANSVYEDVMESSDDELQKENEMYRGFRAMGLDEETARGRLISYQQGFLPIIAGALTGFTSKFGAEGIFTRNLSRSLTGGAVGRTAKGALREGLTEGMEEGGADLLTQYGISQGREGDLDLDWYAALQAATKGAAAGGPMGGAVEGIGGRRPDIDPDRELAATGTPLNQTVADKLASTGEDMGVLAAAGGPPQPGATQPATPGATAPTDQVVAVTRPGTTILEPGITVDPSIAAATADQVGTAQGNRSAQGMLDKGVAQGIFTLHDTSSDLGESPDATAAPPPLDLTGVPSGPALDPAVQRATTVDPTKDHQGRPLSPAAVQRRDKVGYGEASRRAEAEGWTDPAAAPSPVAPPVAPAPVPAEAAVAPPVEPVQPTGPRVLPDLQAEEQLEAERAAQVAELEAVAAEQEATVPPPEKQRAGPRETAGKAERRAAGLPERMRKRDADRVLKMREVKEKTEAALKDIPYSDDLRKGKTKAILEYMNQLVAASGATKKLTPRGEDDAYVRHIAAAQALKGGRAAKSKLEDFMINDFALRSGDKEIVQSFQKGDATRGGGGTPVEGVAEDPTELSGGETAIEDEAFGTDESGADIQEIQDREAAPELEEDEASAPSEDEAAPVAEETYQEPEVRERPKVEVKDTGVAGQDRAGKFVKVEGKRRLAKKPPTQLDPLQEKMVKAGMTTREKMVEGNKQSERAIEAMERVVEAEKTAAEKLKHILKTPPENRAGTANTEKRAAEQLIEQRREENADALPPGVTPRLQMMRGILSKLDGMGNKVGKFEEHFKKKLKSARLRLDNIEQAFAAKDWTYLERKSDRRAGMVGGALQAYENSQDGEVAPEVSALAREFDELAAELEEATSGGAIQGEPLEQFRKWQAANAPSPLLDLLEDIDTVEAPSVEEVQRGLTERFGNRFSPEQIERIAKQTAAELAEDKKKADENIFNSLMAPELPARVTTIGKLLKDRHFTTLRDGINALIGTHFSKRLADVVADVPVTLVDFSTMYKMQAQMARQGWGIGGVPAAFYFKGEIVVNYDALTSDKKGATAEDDALAATRVFLHESSHAIYDTALAQLPEVAKLINRLRKDVQDHFASKGQQVPRALQYGLTNAKEFIAEAMSNPDFQEMLATVQTSADTQIFGKKVIGGSSTNTGLMKAWDAFKMIFLKIIRANPQFVKLSALDYVFRATRELDLMVDADRRGIEQAAAWAAERTDLASPLRVKEQIGDTLENAFAPVGETSLWRRRWALSAAALDHIRQHFAGYFPGSNGDLLAKMQDTVKEIAADRDRWIKEAGATIEGFGKFTQDIQGRIADVVQGLTIHNLNVTQLGNNEHLKGKEVRHAQALAQLPGLQAQFDALPASAQKWVADASAYFRKIENNIRYERVQQALVRHKDTFTPQTYKDVVEAVMEGKLTEAHRGMIDDDALYQVLRDEEGFKRIKGLYFPLGRQGNYVVNTQDDLGDIGSGKVLNQMSNKQSKVVEWTAKTKEEAEAAYRAYAESTPLTIVNVGVERRNEMGSKITAAQAKDVPHTVSYRARVMTQGTYMFDSEKEANRFAKANKNASLPEDKRAMYERPEMVSAHLVAVHKSIDKTNASASTKALMKNAATDAAIRSMSGNRMQKHRLQRMGAKGASKDLSRTMINYTLASSGYLAKMRHQPTIRDTFDEMEGIYQRTEDKLKPARQQIIAELRKRLESNIIDPKGNGPIVQNIMLLSFLDKLASPMYSVVQSMQPWMTTAPVLGGRHGFLRAASAMNRAYNDIGAIGQIIAGGKNIGTAITQAGKLSLDTRDIVGSIMKNAGKALDGDFVVRALTYANDRTPFLDSGMELASDIAAGKGMIGTGLSQVDRAARQLPMSIEAVNRAVTVMAAARLGVASGMSQDAAIKYAFDTVQNTQGDYSVANQPAFFNNPLLRPALQFKKYAHMMSYLLYDMLRRARFETGKERRVALKQLAGIFGVQIMMAGSLGVPGMEIVKLFAMVAAALGFGEGYDELERDLEKMANESMGEDLGQMLTRGVIPRGLGVALDLAFGKGAGRGGLDLSSRLSLSDMWTGFGEPKASDRDSVLAYFGGLAAGAPGSMALDWWEGGKSAMNGDFLDAAIKLLPLKVASDTLKAAKGRFDETTSIPITGDEAFLQAMGARTGRMARAGEKIGEKIATGKQLESEKKELQRDWMRATTKGEQLKIKVKIAEHNKAAEKANKPTLKVYTKGLDKAKTERQRERDALIGG